MNTDDLKAESFKWTPDRLVGSEIKSGLFFTLKIDTLKDHKTVTIKRDDRTLHRKLVTGLSLYCPSLITHACVLSSIMARHPVDCAP